MKKILMKVVMAFAEELSNFESRVIVLMNEAIPGLSSELLPEWETDLGLPDACSTTIQTEVERQTAAHAKHVANYDGQNKQFYIDYAASLGMLITITESFGSLGIFRVNVSRVDRTPVEGVDGARLWSIGARFKWTVNLISAGSVSFEYLQCRFNQLKPAHTLAIFNDLT